ncbi:MAG: hypothetical protein IIC99_04185 [Chloroflexi bacterium]|nr:hypothetical protein [Chloroflexota bacterium]
MEAPALSQIQEESADRGVRVVAINTAPWSGLPEWQDFWRRSGGGEVIWATDDGQSLVRLLQVTSLGTTMIIDRQGRLSYRDDGATPYSTLRREVDDLL